MPKDKKQSQRSKNTQVKPTKSWFYQHNQLFVTQEWTEQFQ